MIAVSLFVYNISVRFYWLAIYLVSPFNSKAKLWIQGRSDWQKKLDKIPTTNKRIWFHCASLGEFEQARPVIEKWKREHPTDFLILTFFSPSGYEIRKDYPNADLVMYLPLDTPNNARLFIEKGKPDIALFVKYEFWYHYLYELKRRNIPVLLFSAVFRKEQVFFKWYGGLFRSMLGMFSTVLVQNEESKKLLDSIDINSAVNPDTRFDRVQQIALKRKHFPLIEKFKSGHRLFIGGSTWPKDEEMIVRLIKENVLPGYRFLLAPHNVTQAGIALLKNKFSVTSSVFLSALNETNAATAQVVIVDNIGQLASLYAYGDIAYIGGGFGTSVHNVLEAAVYGIPVIFGPQHHKSIEANELLSISRAFTFTNYTQLVELITELYTSLSTSNSDTTNQYINTHLGGTEKVYAEMNRYL